MKIARIALATIGAMLACGVATAAQAGACVHRPAPAGTVGKRVAMIVGNGAYGSGLPALANPARDADATAKAVGALGCEVFLATDAGGAALGQCLDQAYAGAADADVALFYYSGHGIQIRDENFLVTTDADAHGLVPVRSGDFTLWNATDGTVVTRPAVTKTCSTSPSARTASCSRLCRGTGVTVLDGIDGSKLVDLRGRATRAEFSPDESRLLLVGDDALTVVDLAAMKPVAVIKGGQLDPGARKRRSASVA